MRTNHRLVGNERVSIRSLAGTDLHEAWILSRNIRAGVTLESIQVLHSINPEVLIGVFNGHESLLGE